MKTLVAYYSAQEHTALIAKKIAEKLGADLFAITPSEPYSEDDLNYMDQESRVAREHDNAELQDVALATVDVPNWTDYDKVILAYPIWWGVSAWPTDSFVKAVDWSGKTIYPIAVSHSSPLGDSDALLKEKANGGDWQPGERLYQDATDYNIQTIIDKMISTWKK